MNQLKPKNRVDMTGGGSYAEDACNYNPAVINRINLHAMSSAIENMSGSDIKVGLSMPSLDGAWNVVITSLTTDDRLAPFGCEGEFNLTDITSSTSYATAGDPAVNTLDLGTTANGTYYVLNIYNVDEPSATTTLTATSAVFVNKHTGGTSSTALVTKKGLSSFVLKGTSTDASIVLGAGFSAQGEANEPTFAIYSISAWTIGQLNIWY